MKNLKVFPKMFIQIFSVLLMIIALVHLLVFIIFPRTYLDSRKEVINSKADEIAQRMEGKDIKYVQQALDLYSESGDIKAFVNTGEKANELKIKNTIGVDLTSNNNSLIIEEREVGLKDGTKSKIQFISTADMQKDAKDLSFKFLPYSLLISLVFSVVVSYLYARAINNNIQEIKGVTDRMMALDKDARLLVDSNNEAGRLKEQINDLYFTLLKSIGDLEARNKEIIKLEKLKYEFFRGASHELKTPLASLKIILENMKYKIGKYKNRDLYIDECLGIVDNLTGNISQILSIYSIENMRDDEELLGLGESLTPVLDKYDLLAKQKNLTIKNRVADEKIYIGRRALNIILSNLLSNAIKYTLVGGDITIGAKDGWFFMENTCEQVLNIDKKILSTKDGLYKDASNGLGLYIVTNLLNNYRINYEIIQEENNFQFKINLAG